MVSVLDDLSSWWYSESWPWYDWFEGLHRSVRFFSAVFWLMVMYKLSMCRTVDKDAQSALNRRFAERALHIVLEMKGYYIKAAQTLCGAGLFPDEFDDVFAVLLDQCPREPFSVVRQIVEAELSRPLEDVFEHFGKEAVAAASIGQVHVANLRGCGVKVAVKVQYPEVERYFRMDVKTIALLMWLQGMGERVRNIFDTVEAQMQTEFNYKHEADFMREISQNVLPNYHRQIAIPLPIDREHHFCSSSQNIQTLCTRKLLTMEWLDGTPIRNHTLQLLRSFAEMHGTTAQELRKQMRITDPSKLDIKNKAVQQALTMRPVSECKSLTLIAAVQTWNCLARVSSRFCCGASLVKPLPAVPLNGPRITRLLFEVHGYELFHHGLFNSDPHAGNVLMLSDGRLGLVDYGAVARLTEDQRTAIAHLLIALADEDDDTVPGAFHACGFRSKCSDPRFALLLAHVSFNRGPFPYDMNRIAPKVGMPMDIDIATLDDYIRGDKLDEIEDFPGHLVMLQRCCMVLSGIGLELGAGRLSAAELFKPQAASWLRHVRSDCDYRSVGLFSVSDDL